MRCPRLSDLPAPPAGKTGWPWTTESRAVPACTPEGTAYPRVSVVTPSLNQGRFIEETIRSVLLQGYPDLEYLVIDGGSKDETVGIIRKYERWIRFWKSAPDSGQAAAINEGLRVATGQYAAYQNSDDIYLPDAFERVGRRLAAGKSDVVFSPVERMDGQGTRSPAPCPIPPPSLEILLRFWEGPPRIMPSQGFFCSLALLQAIGRFNPKYHYKMDFDVYCRLLPAVPPERITLLDEAVAAYRIYEGSKTGLMSSRRSAEEGLEISRRCWGALAPESRRRMGRDARRGMAFLALCRAEQALKNGVPGSAFGEMLRAWLGSPRLVFTRWNVSLTRGLFRSRIDGQASCL
jgi:glycosyltransferase involved in cell wall biosynthesis